MNSIFGILFIASVISFVSLQACNTTPIPNVRETPNVGFNSRIKPITTTVCIRCHNGKRLKDFSEYPEAFINRQEIYSRVVLDKSMPLGKEMSDRDRALFRDWYLQGSKK